MNVMLSVVNVCTNAIDDPDVAREEILTQLKEKNLLKHSVGIIGCHQDYIEQEVVKAIAGDLPFDVVGCSVLGSAINGHGSMEQLILTVLTSDDVMFSAVLSETIAKENVAAPIEKAYQDARKSLDADPSFILILAPLMEEVVGDQMLEILNRVCGGIPVFGTLSNDVTPGYLKSYVFKNGETDTRKMALVVMSGPVNPRFHVTAIARRSIQQNNAVVTGSEGYLVTSINDMPVLDYFATLGISKTKLGAIAMVPFLVDFGDGTEPVAYSMYNITESGTYCGGAIPRGSKITFAEVDPSGILETAELTLRAALNDAEKNGANGIIAIPCFSRPLMLSPNVDAEIIKSLNVVGDKVPFALFYSGGEICPVYNKQHGLVNRFHNLTYTLVVF